MRIMGKQAGELREEEIAMTRQSAGGRLRGCLGVIIVLPLLVVGIWVLTQGLDSIAAPWAHAPFGGPTLTGHWVSTFTMPSGLKFAVYMEIERPNGGEDETTDQNAGEIISGRAAWCDSQGRHVDNGVLTGYVPSFTGYNGNADKVTLEIDPGKPPVKGLLPSDFHGQWHGDTLTLGTEFAVWTGDSMVGSTADPDQYPPTMVVFKHGERDAFQAACAKLG